MKHPSLARIICDAFIALVGLGVMFGGWFVMGVAWNGHIAYLTQQPAIAADSALKELIAHSEIIRPYQLFFFCCGLVLVIMGCILFRADVLSRLEAKL